MIEFKQPKIETILCRSGASVILQTKINALYRMCKRYHSCSCSSSRSSRQLLLASMYVLATLFIIQLMAGTHVRVEGAPARVSMHQVSRQTNQYFLNEFCDLESKTMRSAKLLKQDSDTNSLLLNARNSASSVRLLPQRDARLQRQPTSQSMPSSISFGFGSSQKTASPVYKQLNCTINVVAPNSHGLLLTVNSIGLPMNVTKLSITLNKDTPQVQHVSLEGETSSANYLLTQPQSSKIAINLHSFQPIDWSQVSFDILFTVYKRGNSTGCPNTKWFDCGDNICVPSSLVCDSNRNCPNGNDEMIFYRCYSPLFRSIAASTILSILVVITIVCSILVVRKRRASLNKQHSLSDNVLASDGDLIDDNNSSKLDLTNGSVARESSYLASNLYLSGFENPVWSNGTLTKPQNGPTNKVN